MPWYVRPSHCRWQPAVAPITSAELDKDALVRQAISLSLQPAVAPNASAELDKDAMERQAVAFSLQPAVIAGPSVEQHGDASLCQAAISIPAGLGLSHCSRYYARCLWSRCRMLLELLRKLIENVVRNPPLLLLELVVLRPFEEH